MLYSFKKEVTFPNGEVGVLDIVAGIADENGDGSICTAKQLAKDSELLNKYSSYGTLKIAVLDDECIYPIITNIISSEVTCINSIVEMARKNVTDKNKMTLSADLKQKMVKLIVAKFQTSVDVANCIVYFATTYLEYENSTTLEGPIKVGPTNFDSRYFAQTQALVNEINNALIWPFTKITQQDNVTAFQENCTDNFFITLPRRNAMLEESAQISSFVPKLSELCDPYKQYPIADITEYKSDVTFPEFMYPMVEGLHTNNRYELYDNEKLFAESLVEWVQFNMKNTLSDNVDISPNNPNLDKLSQDWLEELVKLLYTRHWFHNINIPVYKSLEMDEDDSNLLDLLDDNTNSDSIVSDYAFRLTASEKDAVAAGIRDFNVSSGKDKDKRVNAILTLISYLKEASLVVGYGAYVQAIIQLARWGERKPTCILIENYPLVFSLGDNKVKTYIGNITDYKVKEFDGCQVSAMAALYNDTPLLCKNFMRSHNYSYDSITAPVGITAMKILENTKNSDKADVTVILNYSIIDVVRSYVRDTGEFKLAGISYENGKFLADNVQMEKNNTYHALKENIKEEDNLETPFKMSEEFENLVMDYNFVTREPLTHFTIHDTCARVSALDRVIEANKFSSKEDLEQKAMNAIIRHKSAAFTYAYGNKLLQIYAKASLKLNELEMAGPITFSDVLNVYKEVLETNNLDICENANATVTETSSNLNKMDMFTAKTESPASSNDTVSATTMNVSGTLDTTTNSSSYTEKPIETKVVERFSFIKKLDGSEEYSSLVDRNGNEVGYAATTIRTIATAKGKQSLNIYTLVAPSELPEEIKSRSLTTMQLSSILYRILFDLYAYESNMDERIVLYFDSLDSMRYYLKLLKSNTF